VIDEGNIKIVIEFNNCESIDSTFLGALVLALKKIKKVNGELVIVYNNELLKSLFFVAGMQNVFKPFTDRNKAVSYLSIIKN
jgi:anti-anti-sigma factor